MQTLRETLQCFWPVATGFARRRLRVALALVTRRTVLVPSNAPHRGELTLDNVTFSSRETRADLQSVSFTVPVGRTVAVVGLSSSGKSSLMRLLFGLYQPEAGRILLDGTATRDLLPSALRQAIAVVPQDTVLFNDTIAANIGFGRVGASPFEIQEAARIAQLDELIASLPYGYDTLVGEHGRRLSSSERQRISIARAALKRPRIVIFDAALSSLDARTEREIRRNLLNVSAHGTTLVIANQRSMVEHADRIVVLDRHGAVSQREELPTGAAQG